MAFDQTLKSRCEKTTLESSLGFCHCQTRSSFMPDAIQAQGMGLMQVMPKYSALFGKRKIILQTS